MTELDLSRGDVSTSLRRGNDGWTVSNLHDAPASDITVETVLQRVGGITDLDLLTGPDSSPEALEAYGLDTERALRIRAKDSAGELVADVLVTRAPGPGWPAFVRREDSDRVVRSSFFEVPVEPRWWFARGPLVRHSGFQLHKLNMQGTALGLSLIHI